MGRGKTSRRGVEGVLKGEGGKGLRKGVEPLRKLPCALLVHAEAAAEWLLNFFVEHAECEWVEKWGGGGLAPAHSGCSPRRAVMGNRHIPLQQFPTPCLFARKEKQQPPKKKKETKELRPGQVWVKQQSGI